MAEPLTPEEEADFRQALDYRARAPRPGVGVTRTEEARDIVSRLSIGYIDKLQRENADDLAFYPLATLAKALENGHVVACEDNGEPAGYLWFGALRAGKDVTIYQACVDYDSRRRHLGWGMVAELHRLAKAAGCTGIRLKCASSAESNEFWQAAGFYCTHVQPGGIKRGRDLNCYRTDIAAGLWTPAEMSVTPSDRPIDLTEYQRLKREGVKMPSRFSRTHYPCLGRAGAGRRRATRDGRKWSVSGLRRVRWSGSHSGTRRRDGCRSGGPVMRVVPPRGQTGHHSARPRRPRRVVRGRRLTGRRRDG